VIENDTFDVYVSRNHLIVAGATALIALGLWFVLRRLPLGRSMRAAAEDARMAMLLGVDPDRTVGAAFLFGGALAGVAGAFTAIHYGPVNFHMGLIIGFKALTASIVGGIGSIPGALLGGLLVALVEAAAAVAVGSEWREIAVFGLLAVLLIFRPSGLLGPRS
jgi:branched-chain amino acid transport system permease protein